MNDEESSSSGHPVSPRHEARLELYRVLNTVQDLDAFLTDCFLEVYKEGFPSRTEKVNRLLALHEPQEVLDKLRAWLSANTAQNRGAPSPGPAPADKKPPRPPRNWKRIRLGLGLFAVFLAVAACAHFIRLKWPGPVPAGQPILRVEVDMHTSTIEHIDLDKSGHFLVTGSHDKTIRIWDISTKKQLSVLRPHIGAGHEGKIFAVAISPDGAKIAAGGWTGSARDNGVYTVYLFDRATGQLERRMGKFGSQIYNLRFSPDGSRLAVILKAESPQVFHVQKELSHIVDDKYSDEVTGVDFDKDGRLVTVCADGLIRLYDSSLKLSRKQRAREGKIPYSVRFSPEGQKLAVGYILSNGVDVFSTAELSPEPPPDLTGMRAGDSRSVVFSHRGELCAGGKGQGAPNSVRCWAQGGSGRFRDIPAGEDTIQDLAPLPDGQVVFASSPSTWGILDPQGETPAYLHPTAAADFRGNPDRLLVNRDGTRIRFGYSAASDKLGTFSTVSHHLDKEAGEDAELRPPRTRVPGFLLAPWLGQNSLNLNGTTYKLRSYESATSLAIAANERWLVVGTERYLRRIDRNGTQRWVRPTPGEVRQVNISGDDTWIVSACNDGSIRWLRAEDGAERLAFFPHKDRERWISWMPDGSYAASKPAEGLFIWHMDRGPGESALALPPSTFPDLYQPGAVAGALR